MPIKCSLIPRREICMIKLAQLMTILTQDFKIRIFLVSLGMEVFLVEGEEVSMSINKISNLSFKIYLEWVEEVVKKEKEEGEDLDKIKFLKILLLRLNCNLLRQ